jgi:LPS sulfotransferase NodH
MAPKHVLIVCFTIRTGSNLFCENLTNAGLGRPDEFFQGEDCMRTAAPERSGERSTADRFWEVVERNTVNDIFAFKIDLFGLRRLRTYLAAGTGFEAHDVLETIFPQIEYVYCSRIDKFRQAISAWNAIETGIWFAGDLGEGTRPITISTASPSV